MHGSLGANFVDYTCVCVSCMCVMYVCMVTGFLEAAFGPRHCVILWKCHSSATSLEGLISMPHTRKKLVSLTVALVTQLVTP